MRVALTDAMLRPVARFALLVGLSLSTYVYAYEVKRDSTGEVIRWPSAVHFVADEGLPRQLEDAHALEAIALSVATVNGGTPGLEVTVSSGSAAALGYDRAAPEKNQNVVVAISEDWAFDPKAIAVTLLTVDARTHRVIDADVALNLQHRRFRVLEDDGTAQQDDIQNTVTHELGHALGLDHNPDEPIAVMFPSAKRGETHKRHLADDDRAGLEFLYPAALDGEQAGTSGATDVPAMGCQAVPSRAALFAGLLPLAWLFAARRRGSAAAAALSCAVLAAPAHAESRDDDGPPPPVAARMQAVAVRPAPPAMQGRLFITEVELVTLTCLRGACPDRLTVRLPGGRQGSLEQWVSGVHIPAPGDLVNVEVDPSAPRPYVRVTPATGPHGPSGSARPASESPQPPALTAEPTVARDLKSPPASTEENP